MRYFRGHLLSRFLPLTDSRAQNRQVLADLRSSIFYFENVAEGNDDERKAQNEDTLTRLKKILERIETELKGKLNTLISYTGH